MLCKQNNIDKGETVIGCDCEGAIKALWGDREPTCIWNSYDILSRIKEEMKDSNIEFSFRHIIKTTKKKRMNFTNGKKQMSSR